MICNLRDPMSLGHPVSYIYTYSLLHLECHSIWISNLNLLGPFSTERGKRDLESYNIDWDLRLEKRHSKCNRLYICVCVCMCSCIERILYASTSTWVHVCMRVCERVLMYYRRLTTSTALWVHCIKCIHTHTQTHKHTHTLRWTTRSGRSQQSWGAPKCRRRSVW